MGHSASRAKASYSNCLEGKSSVHEAIEPAEALCVASAGSVSHPVRDERVSCLAQVADFAAAIGLLGLEGVVGGFVATKSIRIGVAM